MDEKTCVKIFGVGNWLVGLIFWCKPSIKVSPVKIWLAFAHYFAIRVGRFSFELQREGNYNLVEHCWTWPKAGHSRMGC